MLYLDLSWKSMKPNAMDAEYVYQSVAGMPFALKTDM